MRALLATDPECMKSKTEGHKWHGQECLKSVREAGHDTCKSLPSVFAGLPSKSGLILCTLNRRRSLNAGFYLLSSLTSFLLCSLQCSRATSEVDAKRTYHNKNENVDACDSLERSPNSIFWLQWFHGRLDFLGERSR